MFYRYSFTIVFQTKAEAAELLQDQTEFNISGQASYTKFCTQVKE